MASTSGGDTSSATIRRRSGGDEVKSGWTLSMRLYGRGGGVGRGIVTRLKAAGIVSSLSVAASPEIKPAMRFGSGRRSRSTYRI